MSNRDAIYVNQVWSGFAGDMLNYTQYPPVNASKRNVTQVPALSVCSAWACFAARTHTGV